EIFSIHYLDEELFKICSFIEVFIVVGLKEFIFEKSKERYSKLRRNPFILTPK
ncbi:hypothetical protein RYX36_005823, partial [Vicia faba]